MRVLRDDNTEVEIVESNDFADTDLRSVIEGDSRNYKNQESFADSGYTTQEFDENEELVAVEEDSYTEDNFDDSYDDE
jgi:DNA-directed RNA polymerase subunit beta